MGRVWAGLVALLAGLAVVVPPAAATGTSDDPPLIGCDRAAERITLTASARLDASCTYTGGFAIGASNVTLDCAGALLQNSAEAGDAISVAVDADANRSRITIRDCHVDGWFHAIDLSRDGANRLAAGHEYDHHLRDVVIEGARISGTRAVGIYVHPYVTRVTLRGSVVTGSGSTGLYLDAGSRYAHVEDNLFMANGFRENGPGGTNTNFGGFDVRYWGPGREGIAIDGASDNVIRRNWIVGNSAGGVFVYTNCGENVHDDPANWLDHRYGAERNHITDNVIAGQGTGVWVGSRMGENVYPMDCSDEPYVSGAFKAVTLDRAPYTSVRRNVFSSADFGVRVEDDHARVTGNHFRSSDPADFAVVVGTPYRTDVLGRPVTDTVVARNVSTIPANPSPYRWVDGITDLREQRNVALGRPSLLCEAPDVPRGPFVMVYAVAPQDPTKPPQPPPPYDVPSLGRLPACP